MLLRLYIDPCRVGGSIILLSDKICIFAVLAVMLCCANNANAEPYSNNELASYISGKVNSTLDSNQPQASKICTEDKGCVIVVY
jgi:hypothetical protein